MTIGTVLLTLTLLILTFKKLNIRVVFKKILICAMVIQLMVERGYFLKIGSFQLTYGNFCTIYIFFISLIFLYSGKVVVKKNQVLAWITTFIILLLGWFFLIFNPTNAVGGNFDIDWDQILVNNAPLQNIVFTKSMITIIIQVLFFLCISFTAYAKFKKSEWLEIYGSVLKISNSIFVLNMIELVTKYIFHSNIYTNVIDKVLGITRATSTELILRGNGFGLSGLTKEPSHYAFVLIVLLLLNFADLYRNHSQKYNKRIKLISLLIIVELCLMMSFSALYFGACLLLIMGCKLLYDKANVRVAIFFVIISIIIVVMVIATSNLMANSLNETSFWGRRLLSLQQEKSLVFNHEWLSTTAPNALEWSNRVRLGSTYETLILLKYRPLIGLGFASVTAHSSLAMLLSGCGIIGLLAYLNTLFWIRNCNIFNYNKVFYFLLIFLYCLLNLFNSLAFSPFMDCWVMLVALAFLILSKSKEVKKK